MAAVTKSTVDYLLGSFSHKSRLLGQVGQSRNHMNEDKGSAAALSTADHYDTGDGAGARKCRLHALSGTCLPPRIKYAADSKVVPQNRHLDRAERN